MQIQELSLHTHHIREQKAFYYTTLGLPLLTETTNTFTVQAGTTRLRFEATVQEAVYHVAFLIPHATFHEAKRWMQKRVPLLLKNGTDEIFFANLNARSFYFCDVVGNILEYIAYDGLNDETEGAFEAPSVLHVSEIGLPVENVPLFAEVMRKQFALLPYGGSVSEDFAFLGDRSGQLVVVKVGRPWLPTDTVLAAIAPVRLTMKGQREQYMHLLPYPYTITVTVSGNG